MTKTLKVIFTISVLLNIAFVGLVSGHYAKKMKKWEAFHSELAPETHELIKATLKNKRDIIRQKKKTEREKLAVISGVLNAEAFDEVKFKDAIEDWREFQNGVIDGKTDTMIRIASQLPQAERQKLSKRFVHVLSGRDGRKKHGGKPKLGEKPKSNEKPRDVVENAD